MSSRFKKRLKQSSNSLIGVSENCFDQNYLLTPRLTLLIRIQFVQLTLVNNHEVGMTVLVDFTDSTEQESNASVLRFFKNKHQQIFHKVELNRLNSILTSSPITEMSFPLIAECSAMAVKRLFTG